MVEVVEVDDVVIDVTLKCPYCGTEWKPNLSDLKYDLHNRLRAKCINKKCSKVFIVQKEVAEAIKAKAKELGVVIEKNVPKEEREEDDIDLEEGEGVEIIRWRGEEYTPEDLIMTKGLEGVYILMERELEKALNELPMKTVSERMVRYVVKRFKSADWYKQSPEALSSLLQSVLRISPAMIQDIVNRVFSIPKKYENIIRLAMQCNPHMFYDALNMLGMQNTMMAPSTPVSNPFGQVQAQPMQPMQNPMMPQQPFDMRSWLMRLIMPQQMQPQMPTIANQETQNDGKYVTKEELIDILDSYFERKKKEEEEKKLYDVLNKLVERIDELEEKIKKKDEDEEHEEEGLKKDEVIDFVSTYLSSLQSQLDDLRKKIEEGSVGKKSALEELVDAAKKLKELENVFGVKKEEIPEDVRKIIEELQKRIEYLSGEIKPEMLKLKELELMREMKKDEAETLRFVADRIASAIERLPGNAAYTLGQLLAMQGNTQPMAHNVVPVGENKVLVLCPKCGKEFESPANVEKIVCPECGFEVAKREGS